MIIHSKFKNYNLTIESDLTFLRQFFSEPNAGFVIDNNVYGMYENYFSDISSERLYLIDAVEENKTIDTVLEICDMMTSIPAKRNAHLVSVGGGITQDITGFAANILYRGIKWTFVPTTLLASCDSCIGGKTSLNYRKYKNLLGTFYPPDNLFICPIFFETLSNSDFKSGLGEVVKFNIMSGERGLENIENNIGRLLKRDYAALNEFVMSSLEYKKGFIETDEFDRGERIKLNFAHTFGHAIETVTNFEIPHGTAVAIGMIMANRISFKRGLMEKYFAERSENVLMQIISIDISSLEKHTESFTDAMRKDKKQIGNQLTAVLMSMQSNDLMVVHDIKEEEVSDALIYFIEKYKSFDSIRGGYRLLNSYYCLPFLYCEVNAA